MFSKMPCVSIFLVEGIYWTHFFSEDSDSDSEMQGNALQKALVQISIHVELIDHSSLTWDFNYTKLVNTFFNCIVLWQVIQYIVIVMR